MVYVAHIIKKDENKSKKCSQNNVGTLFSGIPKPKAHKKLHVKNAVQSTEKMDAITLSPYMQLVSVPINFCCYVTIHICETYTHMYVSFNTAISNDSALLYYI